MSREGNRLFSAPEIVITGIHDKAEASVDSALMVNGGVGPVPSDGTGISVTHPGSGYVRTPSVTIAGDGTGAKAFARRVSGEVQDVIVRNPGIDYTTARVIFSGGHSEAYANAVMVDGTLQSIQISQGGSGYLSGTINHINVSNLGSGYVSAPTIIISDPPGVGTLHKQFHRLILKVSSSALRSLIWVLAMMLNRLTQAAPFPMTQPPTP